MIVLAKSVLDGLLDLVYPPKCLVCGTFGPYYLCKPCISQIERVSRPYCPRCGHTLHEAHCRNCWGRVRSFATGRAAGHYGGTLREAIHQFKYGGARMLAHPLAFVLYQYLVTSADFPWRRVDCVVPVPIHVIRQRTRGYNQSELLAEELCRMIGLPMVSDALIRKVYTRPQVELSGSERRSNVEDAFRVVRPALLKGKTILLIDDVGTTGSTVHECSLALLRAGVARIYVLCLAFGH